MTCLFFFWGFITVLNDILIPFLKESFDLNYTQAMLVQFCFFGAYFIVSPFAASLIDKVGLSAGYCSWSVNDCTGLCAVLSLCRLSCVCSFPGSLFVLASGITILQVAANPYVAALGPEKTAASRLNLAQAANSSGTTVGLIVGAALILGAVAADASAVQMPYLMIGALLVVAALLLGLLSYLCLAHVEATVEDFGRRVFGIVAHLVLGAAGDFPLCGWRSFYW